MQEHFNQYCLTKRVASKPSGSVYLAYSVQDISQKVALETFDAAYCPLDQPTENFLQKVEEIKLLRHSSIVPVLDVGVEQGQPYVVREYLASDSLRHRLDYLSPQRMGLQEALTIVFQVGQVLSYAHERHILHGSLKPETIFFNGNDKVLLSDFGLANFIDVTKLSHKSDLQMLNYLAPEQFVGSTTEKSDQYALACLAYELITGQMPFSAQNFPSIERDESGDIDQAVQAQVPSFCENSQCLDYGKVGRNNLRKFGKTRRGTQRWQCKTCQATLTFSPMSAKRHTKLPVSLSDLVPDLLRPIEAVVLKAMAQNPSERYTDVSQFLKALQVASASPPYIVSRSQVAPSFGTFIATSTEPLEKIESEVTLTTRVSEAASVTDLLEGSQHRYNGRNSNKAAVTLAESTYVEAFSAGGLSRSGKQFTSPLWLAFALSGIVLLLGTVILYALVPLRSPVSPHLEKSSPTVQSSVQVAKSPVVQSLFQKHMPVGQSSNLPVSLGKKLSRADWTASASIPNDLPSNALDGNSATRWSSGQAQTSGEWFLVDMGSIYSFSSITLDTGSHYDGDYPQGYQVFVSPNGSTWGNPIANGNGSGQLVTISFASQSARFIKVVLTTNSGKWWSIQEFNVSGASGVLNRSGWTASASSSNLVPSNAIDGDPVSRWSTHQAQTAGNWFLVDMGSIQHFSGITLDNGHFYAGDYPQGYQVFVSADGSNWGNAVASGNGSGSLVTISFATQSARFIKVVLTVNGGDWWSIADFNVYS